MQLLSVSVLIIGLALCVPINCEESDDQLWEMFKIEHSKKYTTPEEESRRKIIFLEKLQYVRENNKRYEDGQVSYALRINEFSDMTEQEVYDSPLYGNDPSGINLTTPVEIFSSPAVSVPDEFDWRKKGAVNPIKYQGKCQSCWAFAATACLESLYFIKTGQLVSLSEQNLVDCSKNNDGCIGGLAATAFDYIRENGGIDTEESYPYSGKSSESCKYNPKNVGASDKGYAQILPSGDEQKLKEAVATIGPIAISIDAKHTIFLDYGKGVMNVPDCNSYESNHAVVVVGYGTTKNGEDFWLIRNSWGKEWGMNGYGMMSRNKNNQCGVATFAVYPKL